MYKNNLTLYNIVIFVLLVVLIFVNNLSDTKCNINNRTLHQMIFNAF